MDVLVCCEGAVTNDPCLSEEEVACQRPQDSHRKRMSSIFLQQYYLQHSHVKNDQTTIIPVITAWRKICEDIVTHRGCLCDIFLHTSFL
jgi:hypothetical protein